MIVPVDLATIEVMLKIPDIPIEIWQSKYFTQRKQTLMFALIHKLVRMVFKFVLITQRCQLHQKIMEAQYIKKPDRVGVTICSRSFTVFKSEVFNYFQQTWKGSRISRNFYWGS
jgi:hypothetical protein